MSKMKIEVKMTNKNKITGMRKLPDKRVSVATVIITYLKDSSPFNKKRRIQNEDTVPVVRTPEIVLKDYCCCHHKSGEEARQIWYWMLDL